MKFDEDSFPSEQPEVEAPPESSAEPVVDTASAPVVDDRTAELVAKGVLFEKIEKLPAGSVVAYLPSSAVTDRVDVRIMVRGVGNPTYLHGHALSEAAEKL